MKFFVILLILGCVGVGNTQEINWQETSHWRLYNIHNKASFSFSVDTLSRFKSILLDNDSMRSFLKDVSQLPVEKTPFWMGHYVASCELKDGAIRKIDIGTYGGFFYDEKANKYYQLPVQIRTEWLNYLSDSRASMSKDN